MGGRRAASLSRDAAGSIDDDDDDDDIDDDFNWDSLIASDNNDQLVCAAATAV